MDRRRLQLCVAAVAITLVVDDDAHAHGSPALVSLEGNQLMVEGNVDGATGWTREVFAETDSDAPLFPLGDGRLLTDFPGWDVTGVAVDSGLWLEPIAAPNPSGGPGADHKVLWHWSQAAGEVADPPAGTRVDLVSADGFGQRSLDPSATPPAPLQILTPDAGDLGQHRHALFYLLDDTPAAPTGAYAFFARLTSPAYEPSDPFLIALNHGLPAADFVDATLAINQAALGLTGDYNADGQVTAADYTVWRDNFDAEAFLPGDETPGAVGVDDYQRWRSVMAAPRGIASTDTSASIVAAPEPSTRAMLALVVCSSRLRRRRRPGQELLSVGINGPPGDINAEPSTAVSSSR